MNQTPLGDYCNPTLLECIPKDSQNIVEVGCMSGTLAREFKKINPNCSYFGIDIEPNYLEFAKLHCDRVDSFDIELKDEYFFESQKHVDCWIFGDVLEHLRDPWELLKKISKVIPVGGCVVACIPNVQNWSVIARLALGDFRYEDHGLLDRTHVRWFTRQTAIELFTNSGFEVQTLRARNGTETALSKKIVDLVSEVAVFCELDPKISAADTIPIQYVLLATLKGT